MTISEVKEYIGKNKIKYEIISEKSNISINTIKSIFSGRIQNPRIDTMNAILKALGLNATVVPDLARDTAPQGVTIIKAAIQDELTAEERDLVARFRNLKEHSRVRLMAYLDGMEAEAKNSKYNRT